jgi:hypothetical protein
MKTLDNGEASLKDCYSELLCLRYEDIIIRVDGSTTSSSGVIFTANFAMKQDKGQR